MSTLRRFPAWFAVCFLAGGLLSEPPVRGAAAETPEKPNGDAADSQRRAAGDLASSNFFAGPIVHVEITVTRADLNKLANSGPWGGQKPEVPATVKVGTNVYEKVAIHLKGAAGSFRQVYSNPALTLNFGKLNDGQFFHGMRKIHLNNSVQDPSRMAELFCGELYRRAGVPATRATHAFVSLNGRDLGPYVLKEGFDKPFLRHHFGKASGNLYDGGFVQDVDAPLERDSGEGPDDHKDLQALAAAAYEGDPEKRLEKLDQILDIDRFITLTALQFLFDDWDGYVRNRNNYRIYHNPTSGKFVFLPHGMDQMFENPNSPLKRPAGGLVARQLYGIPEMNARLNRRIGELTNTVFTTAATDEVIGFAQQRLISALGNRNESRWLAHAIDEFHGRVKQRLVSVTAGSASPVKMDASGLLSLRDRRWVENLEGGGAELERRQVDGRELLAIRINQANGVGSWRTTLMLAPGVYRLQALAKADGVKATQSSRGTGGGVRISGDSRVNRLVGTCDWRPVSHDFEVTDQTDVQLVVELRGHEGEVAFDLASLQLRRL